MGVCIVRRLKFLASNEPWSIMAHGVTSWFTICEVKDHSGDWRGLNVTFPGVEMIRGEGGIRSRRILPIGWYVAPWGNMTPALTFKSI